MPKSNMHRQLWHLAWPIMLSNASIPLLGLIDTAILGHLEDHTHLAAVAMGTSLLTFILWSFGFLRMGTTALVAQTSGALTTNELRQNFALTGITQSALGLAVLIAMLLVLLSTPLILLAIKLVAAVDAVTPLAEAFLQIRFYAAPATLMNYVMLGYFIGLGKTRIPLMLLVTGNSANAVLDYIAVYELHLGSAGVAYATNLVEYGQLIVSLFLAREHLFCHFSLAELKRHWPVLFRLNFDLFVRTLLLLFTLTFFMSQGARHSAALLAANSILLNLLLFVSNALDGFAIAAESIVGKACGQKNTVRIWQAVKASGQWSLATAIIFSFILFFFHWPILNGLTSQPDVLALLTEMKFWLIALPLAGFGSYWLDGIFIGLADGKTMRNSLIMAVVFCFFPVWWIFDHWSYHGLWLALYSFLIMRALWLLIKLKTAIHKATG